MKFRTALLVTSLVVVAALVAAVVVGVGTVVDRAAREDVESQLVRSRRVFEDLWALRSSLQSTQARVTAEEPRLKAVVATDEISHDTILGVTRDLSRGMGSDVFLLTDADGYLLVDVAHPEEEGASLAELPIVAEALEDGESSGVWTDDAGAYQVHGRRLAFGATPVGVLVVGYALDEQMVETVRRQTGNDVIVLLDGEVLATPDPELASDEASREKLAALVQEPSTEGAPVEVELGGARYLAVAAPLGGYHGDRTIGYVVLSSLDRALAPGRQLKRVVYGVAGAAALFAVLIAFLLARRMSRPLDDLVTFTRSVAAGDLGVRTAPGGMHELRTLGQAMNRMVGELEANQTQIAAKERLEKEMEIASQLQTSMLPRSLEAPELDISARMLPASEVGGDYYDVLPVPGGACWIGIGDVAGHGLPAGVVMLMIQTAVMAIVQEHPDATPAEIVTRLNRILVENIRQRLEGDEHVTLTLLRHHGGGRFVYAGAHEDMVILRKETGKTEIAHTPGTWLGFQRDIEKVTTNHELRLEPGDTMILFTDGVTEGRSPAGELFGMERLRELVEACAQEGDATPEVLRDRIFDAVQQWLGVFDDDITVVVVAHNP